MYAGPGPPNLNSGLTRNLKVSLRSNSRSLFATAARELESESESRQPPLVCSDNLVPAVPAPQGLTRASGCTASAAASDDSYPAGVSVAPAAGSLVVGSLAGCGPGQRPLVLTHAGQAQAGRARAPGPGPTTCHSDLPPWHP
jgi:hypothetical protein